MASLIRIKRSGITTAPSGLAQGELAYSWLSNKLFIGTGTETDGIAANLDVIGGKYFTDIITAATNTNTASTLVLRDSSGNFSAGTITATLAGNASTATKWQTARDLSLTGDATGTLSSVDGSANVSATLTLKTVNSNTGTFGGSTAVPVITVNEKGLITAVSTSTISTTLNITDGTNSDAVALVADTLTFEGGTGVTTTVSNNKVSFAIGQAVATTSNVTFNDVTVNGTLTSNDITSTNVTVSGNAIITGDLTVQGTTTTVNSTTVEIGDNNLHLAKDATLLSQADGGGVTLGPVASAATITYTTVDDRWNLNKPLNVSTVYGALSGNASTATKLATSRSITAIGDASWTVNFDGSANASATLTLATVNSSIGSFGDSTTVPTITVNAKGLVTSVSSTAIPTATTSVNGLASFSSSNFSVTSGLVAITAIDGGTY